MSTGQHLDRLGLGAVGGDGAVVVPIGAHQVGEHLGIAGIGLGPAHVVPFPIPSDGEGVDGVHLVAGRSQGMHPQPSVGFDADGNLRRIIGQVRHQLVEASDPLQPFRESATRQPLPRPVHHMDVVMGLGPVVAYKDHLVSFGRRTAL